MKTKKRAKSSRMHGRKMGTHGGGARKKRKGSGHRGGKGMSGSGKRADHKKSLVLKKYGHGYFGKKGITSIGSKRDKREGINLRQIEVNLEKYGKKSGDKWEVNLKNYKILGTGEAKNKLVITAKEASKSAIEKVKKAGGEIILPKRHRSVYLKKLNEGAKEIKDVGAKKDVKKVEHRSVSTKEAREPLRGPKTQNEGRKKEEVKETISKI